MEQPLKKRKLHDAPGRASTPIAPATQEDIVRRRRNKEEIRNLYECYKRIRFCISTKDARLMPDFEQSYLSLITASRGCTSVQRIVAELIPRYASYCPTALEAAAKVAFNLHNWSFALVLRGEDADGIAYQTAKTCIFGLVDICLTAASEAPTSSVIRGICSAVFLDVFSFFTSTLDGKDIYQLTSSEIAKLSGTTVLFTELEEEKENEDTSILDKLVKFRALSLLRIFFSCPKNLLAACFELLHPCTPDNGNQRRANYFIHQVTTPLGVDVENSSLGDKSESIEMHGLSDMASSECIKDDDAKDVSNDKKLDEKNLKPHYNCPLELVIKQDAALRNWILMKYKKLTVSLSSELITGLSSCLEKVFGPLLELIQNADFDEENNDSYCGKLKFTNHPYQSQIVAEGQGKAATLLHGDRSFQMADISVPVSNKMSDQVANASVSPGIDSQMMDEHMGLEGAVPISRKTPEDSERRNKEDLALEHHSKHKGAVGPTRLISREHLILNIQKKHLSPTDAKVVPFPESSSRFASDVPSSEQSSLSTDPVSSLDQTFWCMDGDPMAMNVFSASNVLFLSSFGHGTPEKSIRLHFEDFGPMEKFLYFSDKNFALIEYRNIIDAVRAREYTHGSSPWRTYLNVKFLDIGFGTRGAINGTVIGDSCYVYVGKMYGQLAKDEVFHWLANVGVRIGRVAMDLTREGALLLEFPSSEEAAFAIMHIRQKRKESGQSSVLTPNSRMDKSASFCRVLVRHIDSSVRDEELIDAFCRYGKLSGWEFKRQSGCCVIYFHSYEVAEKAKLHLDGAKFGLTNIRVEIMTNSPRTVAGYVKPPSGSDNKLGNLPSMSLNSKSEVIDELVSPAMEQKPLHDRPAQSFQSTWAINNFAEASGPTHVQGGHAVSHYGESNWWYKKPEFEQHNLASGPFLGSHPVPVLPPLVQPSSFVTPIGSGSHTSWDGMKASLPLNQISAGMAPISSKHTTTCTPLPFIPSSITPLAQFAGNVMHCEQVAVNPPISPPPLPNEPPPPSPPPPPLPLSHPTQIPPPPGSPTPRKIGPHSNLQRNKPSAVDHQWQGALCKSGVQYCTVNANRENSCTCRYSDAVSEPSDWPAKLDVTKRTDFRHVVTTFNSTTPNKREVCRLIPSSEGDHKGVQDFISYLKQRECAGVIKIPSGKCMRSRLLFIVPSTSEFCSLFSVAPEPSESLLALALPKDATLERA